MSNFKHIFALLLGIGILGGMYYVATTLEFFSSAGSKAVEIEEQVRVIEREVAAQLKEVEALTLDESVLQSDVYKSLEDRSTPQDVPDLSRENPFAPF